MFDAETLGTIAQVGLGLAGFSGIALVLVRGESELTRLEADRLGIMLGSSLGAMFLALLPLVLSAFAIELDVQCRIASGVMAAYTVGFLRFYVARTWRMRAQAPEIVHPLPFGLVSVGHGANLVLQTATAAGIAACAPAYLVGLFWMLFHGAYQFGRILFIRPRAVVSPVPEAGRRVLHDRVRPEELEAVRAERAGDREAEVASGGSGPAEAAEPRL